MKRDYYIETTLTYTPFDGGKGYIVKIREGKKPDENIQRSNR